MSKAVKEWANQLWGRLRTILQLLRQPVTPGARFGSSAFVLWVDIFPSTNTQGLFCRKKIRTKFYYGFNFRPCIVFAIQRVPLSMQKKNWEETVFYFSNYRKNEIKLQSSSFYYKKFHLCQIVFSRNAPWRSWKLLSATETNFIQCFNLPQSSFILTDAAERPCTIFFKNFS